MNAIIVFCILSLLLVSGKILRTLIPLFQKLYIPSSVIGGLLGLVIFSVFGSKIPAEWQSSIKMIPGFMINVIFAALFLGAVTPKLKTVFATAFPQICMGQMLAFPSTMLVSSEIVSGYTETPEEAAYLEQKLMIPYILGGLVSATICSVVLASFCAGLL